MNKTYLWLIGPITAGILGWALSGNWKLGVWLLLATALANYVAFKGNQKP